MSMITAQTDPYRSDRVYGRDIRTWTVDGVAGRPFADVIAFASLRQASATETMASAVTDFVELRQRKVSDLGEVLAVICEAMGSMNPKESDPDERYSRIEIAELERVNALLAKYGLDPLQVDGAKGINYTNAALAETKVRSWLDGENNDLRQMLNLLEGIVKRRENSFSIAAKVMEKTNMTATQTVRAYGN